MDTIFAVATAHGKAGVAVVRISGSLAWDGVQNLCRLPKPRYAGLRNLRSKAGVFLDQALVLTFDDGESFTGEKTVELQLHGSTAVLNAVLNTLSQISGFRLAEPGEFTRRALENGRLDLTEVEALGDLIDAETEAQRKQASRVLQGELARIAEAWRQDMVESAALVMAVIDFADEDVPEDVSDDVLLRLNRVATGLQEHLAGYDAAERIRSGFEVAIVGAPNVGKSTLLNALAKRDAAIISDIAGTTRDVIEVHLDLGGLPVTILDTAGVRATSDPIESLGVDRAISRAKAADLRVFLLLPDQNPPFSPDAHDVVLSAKGDLYPAVDGSVSGLTGKGLDSLIERISEQLSERSSNAGLITRQRQMVEIRQARDNVCQAIALVKRGQDAYDLAAEELRSAIRSLESLLGRVDLDDVLDDVFSRFCLGK